MVSELAEGMVVYRYYNLLLSLSLLVWFINLGLLCHLDNSQADVQGVCPVIKSECMHVMNEQNVYPVCCYSNKSTHLVTASVLRLM